MKHPHELNRKAALLNETLFKMYGKQGWWPTTPVPGQPPIYQPGREDRTLSEQECFEVIVGSVLAQNTAWVNAEKAIINLTGRHMMDPEKIAASDGRLETAIMPARYFNQKAKRLRGIAQHVLNADGISVLKTFPTARLRKLLLSWEGIGPETADCILCYALHRPIFVVDTYTRRLFGSLGLPSDTYENMQIFIHRSIPPSAAEYGDFHARIVAVFTRKGSDTLYQMLKVDFVEKTG